MGEKESGAIRQGVELLERQRGPLLLRHNGGWIKQLILIIVGCTLHPKGNMRGRLDGDSRLNIIKESIGKGLTTKLFHVWCLIFTLQVECEDFKFVQI